MTVNLKKKSTIIQFRADEDIVKSAEWTRLRCRVTTFKGTAIGTTGDGYDVIAVFPSDADADQFLRRYDENYAGDVGAYILVTPVTIDL